MKDSNDILNQIEPKIARSPNNSATAAGPADGQRQQRAPASDELIDTLNQVFELFRVNYHNQYFSAYPNLESLNQAKRLWLETLREFTPEVILRAARKAIEESEYLPVLNRMIKYCRGTPELHGLPDVHSAYLEACNAPSPKMDYHWSHPAVYYAGKACDWYFLAQSSEQVSYPAFRDQYLAICERILKGEDLPMPQATQLAQKPEAPLSGEENHRRMEALRKEFDL